MSDNSESTNPKYTKQIQLLQIFIKIMPAALIFVAIAGSLLAFKILSFAVAISSLLYSVPMLAAGAFLLFKKNDTSWLSIRIRIGKSAFQYLLLITLLIYIINTILLINSPGRPFAYFLFTGVISATIFMQILCKRAKWTNQLIIIEIVALSLNIIWGVVLKYPLFFGATDTLGHLRLIDIILQTSHTFDFIRSYQNFPAYHIFNATASEITGISSRTSLFIFMGLAWQISILVVYLLLKNLTNSLRIALIGCLLFATNPQEIFYGIYPETRSLAFVLLLCWVYLIFRKANLAYIFMTIFIMWALVLTHHATVLFAIPLLLLILLFQRLARTRSNKELPLLPIVILFVSFFFYLFYVATTFTNTEIPAWFNTIITSDTPSSNSVVTKDRLESIINVIYYSIFLVFFLMGAGSILASSKTTNKYTAIFGITIASLAFLFLFIPGPTDILPQSQSALLYRFPLLVSPLIMFVTAFGVVFLTNLESYLWRFLPRKVQFPVLVILLVGISTFFSMVSGGSGRDFPYFIYPSDSSSEYFTHAELTAFTFIQNDANSSVPLYSDYATIRNEYNFYNFRIKKVLQSSDTRYISKGGYIIIRTGELKQRGSLLFSLNGSTDANHVTYFGTLTDIINQQAYTNNIYNNNNVYVFKPDPIISD